MDLPLEMDLVALQVALARPPDFAPRSSGWPAKERAHLAAQPDCQVCGIVGACEVHHVRPFHLYAELEEVDSNLVTFCRLHHFEVGHLRDWRAWNPEVIEDAARQRGKIKTRTYARLPGE